MTPVMPFGEVLEAVDRLPLEEQQALAAILRRRLVDANRRQLIADVHAAEEEFQAGGCKRVTPDELLRELSG